MFPSEQDMLQWDDFLLESGKYDEFVYVHMNSGKTIDC